MDKRKAITVLTRDKYMLFEEADKVLKYLDKTQYKSDFYRRAHCMINLMLWTGARAFEAKDVKIKDLNIDAGFIEVIGKGKKKRQLLLSNGLVEILNKYLAWKEKKGEGMEPEDYLFINRLGFHNTYQAVLDMWRKILKESGIKRKYGVHVLRHTFAFKLYESTKNLVMVSQLMGHSNLVTTMIYTVYNPQQMTDKINGLWK